VKVAGPYRDFVDALREAEAEAEVQAVFVLRQAMGYDNGFIPEHWPTRLSPRLNASKSERPTARHRDEVDVKITSRRCSSLGGGCLWWRASGIQNCPTVGTC
jgi:hypothetical protein